MAQQIALGSAVIYSGSVPNRGDDEFFGFVGRIREDGIADVLLVLPSKGGSTGSGAPPFRWHQARLTALKPARGLAVGTRVVFCVRASEESVSIAGYRTVVEEPPVVDPAEARLRAVEVAAGIAEPPKQLTRTVPIERRGSIYHREMTEFLGFIARPYEDGTADLLLMVPSAGGPLWARGISEGIGAGQFRRVV